MNRLNEIEARANAATPGPWEADGSAHVLTAGDTPTFVARCADPDESDAGVLDAEFIAHARTDVPDMAAALRAVLELHVKARPITAAYGTQEGGDYCYSCAEDWPCPTVTAIRRYLGDDL